MKKTGRNALAPTAAERPRGRPAGRRKEVISISLDKDILTALRATGPGWQTRVNDLLKAVVAISAES